MQGRRNPFVAREGLPWLALALLAMGLTLRYAGLVWVPIPAAILAWLLFVFRDPRRRIPAAPLGIVSPVDGVVTSVGLTDRSELGTEAHRVVIRIDSFGTYTARCPVEGKVMDFRGEGTNETVRKFASGLWVKTDEGDDVVLKFRGYRFGLPPRAFAGFGERIGQGQRCAYLRMTRFAEVQFPIHGRALVEEGQEVLAGADLLGKLPHP